MSSQDSHPITVAGHKLSWSVRNWPQWTSVDGFVGMSVEVIPVGPPRQRLIIEFPRGTMFSHRMSPERVRPKVTTKQIAAIVQSALSAGWSPVSRGKPFVFEVKSPDA
jgi:hypothetical protein